MRIVHLLKGHVDRVHRKLCRTQIPQLDLIQEAIGGTKNEQGYAQDEHSRKSSIVSTSSSKISTYKGMF